MTTLTTTIHRVYRETDWEIVRQDLIRGLQIAIVLTLLAGRYTRRAWDALPELSERMGRWYASRLVSVPYPVAPVVARVAIRQQLESMTGAQLRQLVGTRRRLAKARLIELAMAG
jgi:hypothetical protein